MPATSALIAAILKERYRGKLRRMLNEETIMIDLMMESTHETDGSRITFPVHTARNTGTQAIGELGYLAASGQQGTDVVNVFPHNVQGSMTLYQFAMDKAYKKGAGAFISVLDLETTGLKNDLKQDCDRFAVAGGRIKGVLGGTGLAAAASTVTAVGANAVTGVGVVQDTWDWDGSYAWFDGTYGTQIVNAVPATWLVVDLFRIDQTGWGNAVTTTGTETAEYRTYVTDYDQAAGTIDIGVADNVAGVGAGFVMTAQDSGQIIAALGLAADTGTYIIGAGDLGTTFAYLDEPIGLFSWMYDPTYARDAANLGAYAGINRTVLGAGPAVLRSLAFTQTTGALYVRAAQTLQRIQHTIDFMDNASGRNPNVIFMNAMQRSRHMALMRTAGGGWGADQDTRSGKGKLDMGMGQLAYGGRKMKTSNKVPNGMMFLLSDDNLFLAELNPLDWLDADGNMLKMFNDGIGRRAAWDAYLYWSYQHYTDDPQGQMGIFGFTL